MTPIPVARTAAAIVAVATLALTAACSGHPATGSTAAGSTAAGSTAAGSTAATGSTASAPAQPAVAFSHCMRSHGLPNYPDPDSSGNLPKTSARLLGVSVPVFNQAQSACQHLLPSTGGSLTAGSLQQCYLAGVCPQTLVRQALAAGRTFAQCMRSHGVPYWPDPTLDSEGRPLFNINVPRPPPQAVTTAGNECGRLDPAGGLLAYG